MRVLVIGLDATVLDPKSSSALRQASYFQGVEADIVVCASGQKQTVSLGSGITVFRAGGSSRLTAFLETARLLRKLRREHRYDVMTVQDPAVCGMLAMITGKAVPLHVQDHSEFFERKKRTFQERVFRFIGTFLVRRAARVRTVSQRGARGLVSLGVPMERIDVVPVATDVARFASVPSRPAGAAHVLCVARLEWQKAIDVLLESWPAVVKAHPDAELRIVGDGTLRSSLESRTKHLGIESSVQFSGQQSDVLPHLAWSNIVVQPSRFEGWGLAVIEAAAAGRPVVMTDVGCAGEVIRDGETGVIVPIEDATALAQAIQGLIDKPEWASRLAEAGCRAVQDLPSKEETIASIRTSYEKAAATPLPSRLWPIFVTAFLVRAMLALLISVAVGPKGYELGDSIQYLGLAKSLLAGNGFSLEGVPFFYRTIGYPLFLAGGLAVFRSTTAFIFFQIFLSSFIPLLILKLGKQLRLGRRAAWIAAWIAVFEPHLVFYSAMVLTETIYTIVLLLGCLWTFRAMGTKRLKESVWAGIAFGVGMLIKPLLQFFPAVVFAVCLPWWKKISWREALKHGVVIVAVTGLVVLPWMIRNQRVFGAFSLSSQGSAAALYYLGTSIVSVRDQISYPEAEARVHQEFLAATGGQGDVSEVEQDAASRRMAVGYIAKYPLILVRLIAINTVTLWTSSNYNSFLNYYHLIPPIDHSVLPPTHYLAQGRIGEFFGSFWKIFSQPFYAVGILGRLVWLVITFLFAIGLIAAYRRIPDRRFQLLFLVALCLYLTMVIWVDGLGIEARLRFPLMPIEFLYAAYGWTVLWKQKTGVPRRLLMITQRVDVNDANISNHVRWISTLATLTESVTVIAQSVGTYELPSNVRVCSLGKEQGASKFTQGVRLLKYLWREGASADAILVLMIPLYVLIAAPFAFVRRAPIYLWYTHKHVSFMLRMAVGCVRRVFTASPESFRLQTPKIACVGHAIDATLYQPNASVLRATDVLVSAGRVAPAKHLDVLIRMLAMLRDQGKEMKLAILGEAILDADRAYEKTLRELVNELHLESLVTFHGGQPPSVVRDWYQRSTICLNASTTGSLDKAVLEALFCECPVITCNEAFRGMLPASAVVASPDPQAFARAVLSFDRAAYPAHALATDAMAHHEQHAMLARMVQLMKT